MSLPTTGILDNYNLRYNFGTAQLEMNTGNEVWIGVPTNLTDLGLANGKILVGNASGIATGVLMSGAVTLDNTGVASLAATSVTGALLTGYSSGAGTVASTDTILQAINKLNGNDALKAPLAGANFTGDITVAATKHVGLDGTTGHIYWTRNASVGEAMVGSSGADGSLLISNVPGTGVTQLTQFSAGPVAGAQLELDADNFFLQQGVSGSFLFKDSSFATLMTLNTVGTLTLTKAPVLPTVDYTASTASPVTPSGLAVSVYNVTVDANLTVNGFSSPYSGQKILLQLHNDASHAVTFATGAGNFRFGTDIPSYTATVSKTDYVGVVWNATDSRWDIVSLSQGF